MFPLTIRAVSFSKELSSSLEKWFEKLVVKSEDDFDKVRQYSLKQNHSENLASQLKSYGIKVLQSSKQWAANNPV